MFRNFLLAFFAALIFALPVSAGEAPADSMIKGAVYDLDKHEKAAKGLTPKHKRQINNIMRFLPMTESRLNNSKNKSHPSWIDASNRLNALKQKLEDLKAGKTATASPSPAKAAAKAPAKATTDSNIKAVVADLDKHEKAAEGLTSADKRQVSNILRYLPMAEARLGSSRNKGHKSWIDASNRLNALKKKLEDLKAAPAQAAAAPATTQAASAGDMTDAQLSKKFLSDYKALSSEIKGTSISKLAEDGVVAGFKGKFAALKELAGSFKDDRNKNQYMGNYGNLERNFNKKTAFAMKKAGKQPASAQGGSELDFANKRALSFIVKDYDRYELGLRSASKFKELEDLTAGLNKIEGKLADIKPNSHPKVAEVRSNISALRGKIKETEGKLNQQAAAAESAKAAENAEKAAAAQAHDEANLHAQFKKDLHNISVALQSLDPGELSKPSTAEHWKKKLGKFEELIAKFSDKESPESKKDIQAYTKLKNKIDSTLAASKNLSIAAYLDYQKDMDTLSALGDKYAVSKVFKKGKEPKVEELTPAIDADKKVFDGLKAKYTPFMDGNTAAYHTAYKEANAFRSLFRHTGGAVDNFIQEKKVFFSEIVPKINATTTKINGMVAKAVKNRSPGFFTGGIQQKINWLEDSLSVFKAAAGENDPKYANANKNFIALKVEVKKADEDLYEVIIAERQTPPNKYAGGDKEKLLQMTVDDFEKAFSGKKILAKGISSNNWERKTEWRSYSTGGLYKVDYSRVQVWVITPKDDRVATILYNSISKNHMKNDEMLVYGFPKDGKGWDLLTSNLK